MLQIHTEKFQRQISYSKPTFEKFFCCVLSLQHHIEKFQWLILVLQPSFEKFFLCVFILQPTIAKFFYGFDRQLSWQTNFFIIT